MINESTDAVKFRSIRNRSVPRYSVRVFAKLLANDIGISTSINLPIGKLYYINPKTKR
jgi:hypothetical protein